MSGDLPGIVLSRVRRCLPADRSHALHEPLFGGRELEYLRRCIDTGWVSTAGRFVDEFEAKLATFTGAKHAIATVNGTAALHVCLMLAKAGAGDEVIVPTLTFIATANAVAYCGAVPHFADSDERTLCIDPRKLEAHLEEVAQVRGDACINRKTQRRIRAVMPMHTFGHPADLAPVAQVCNRFRLALIEDAAEALGSRYRGEHVGNFGRSAALSFNGNKIVTSGGGGAVLTNDPGTAEAARHITTTARIPARWEFIHDAVAYNYRLPNLNAALGLAQLEQIDEFLARKRALAARYSREFEDCRGIRVFEPPSFAESNYWLNTLVLERDDLAQRDAILEQLNANGIGARPIWRLMHRLPMFADCPRMDLSVAEELERRLINVPSSAFLG